MFVELVPRASSPPVDDVEEERMSGHSKWATTKHKKAVVDARRGKMFAKLIKNIEVAARMGGGDLGGNPTLYDAIQKAKKSSVPNDNIDRAVKRGSGAEAGGADYTTIMYEGYGPAGVAMLIECLTDNRNRAAMEVRTAMTRNGGSLADPGSVSFLFNRKGVVIVPQRPGGQAGHRGRRPRGHARRRRRGGQRPRGGLRGDHRGDRPGRRPHRAPGRRRRLRLRRGAVRAGHAGRSSTRDGAGKVFRLVEALEDLDDVQNVFANFDVPDEVMAELDDPGTRVPSRVVVPDRVSYAGTAAGRVSVCTEQVFGRKATSMRVLGIDPGLTRCGLGVVEGSVGRPLTLVDVNVVRTSADQPVAQRLVTIEKGIDAWLDEHRPDAVAVERVFARSTPARSWAPPRPAASRWSAPPAAGCRSPCTRRARSRPRSPAAAAPTRPRWGRW